MRRHGDGGAADRAPAVVGGDHVAVARVGPQQEVVVEGRRADVDDLAVPSQLVTRDDAVGTLRRGPADLHRLGAGHLQGGGTSNHRKHRRPPTHTTNRVARQQAAPAAQTNRNWKRFS